MEAAFAELRSVALKKPLGPNSRSIVDQARTDGVKEQFDALALLAFRITFQATPATSMTSPPLTMLDWVHSGGRFETERLIRLTSGNSKTTGEGEWKQESSEDAN